jgi:TRAP-type C4-dicarboxylate transport system permease small subunit
MTPSESSHETPEISAPRHHSGAFFSGVTRTLAFVAKYCLILAVAGLVAIIAAVTTQVFGRYVLNDTPTWAEALAMVLVLWVTMLGAAVGVRDAGHIGMESLLVLVPEKIRLKLEIVIHALVAVFGGLMAWNGSVLAESVMSYNIPTLGIPEGLNHVPLAIAGVLIVLFSIEHIIALIRNEEVIPAWH